MSYKREDERYNEDPIKNLRNVFDYQTGKESETTEDGEQKPPQPRLRIVGDRRDTGKRKRPQ